MVSNINNIMPVSVENYPYSLSFYDTLAESALMYKALQQGFDGSFFYLSLKDKKIVWKALPIQSDIELHNQARSRVSVFLNSQELSEDCEQLESVMEWCSFMGFSKLMMPLLQNRNLGRILNYSKKLSEGLKVVMFVPSNYSQSDLFFHFYKIKKTYPNLQLGLLLDQHSQTPPLHWRGHAVKHLLFSPSSFTLSSKGFPVLVKGPDKILIELLSQNLSIYLGKGALNQKTFITHILKSQGKMSAAMIRAAGYQQNILQPLQPYRDNLKSQTYQVFEEDTIKYDVYEQAFFQALKSLSSSRILQVLYVGAGRGALINRVFKAANRLQKSVRITALQKNPFAVMSLRSKQRLEQQWEKVQILECDARNFKKQYHFDMVISELLGSFGDNQLSPQCLANIESQMDVDTIFVPKRYASYLSPVCCSKAFDQLSPAQRSLPYVVRMKDVKRVEGKQLFRFEHPGSGSLQREGQLRFTVQEQMIVQGFAGYFKSQLHKGVQMSILPDAHTPQMLSWFPIFFPLSRALLLRKADQLCVRVWRVCRERTVWYEWLAWVESAQGRRDELEIQNLGGASWRMGL